LKIYRLPERLSQSQILEKLFIEFLKFKIFFILDSQERIGSAK